jgi:hypothetical protein
MILSPRQIDCAYEMIGEEPSPGIGLRAFVESILQTFGREIWAREVDHAIVGGDPFLVLLKLRSILRAHTPGTPLRIAIFEPSGFSTAPLAALEDEDVRDSMMRANILRSQIERALAMNSSNIVHTMLENLAGEVFFHIKERGATLWTIAADVEAARIEHDQTIVLRVIPHATDLTPDTRGAQEASQKSRELYEKSKSYFDSAWRILRSHLRKVSRPIPDKERFATLIITRNISVLSGFVSPGAATGRAMKGSAFSTDGLEAQTFNMAHGVPDNVSGAIAVWKADLVAAAQARRQSKAGRP